MYSEKVKAWLKKNYDDAKMAYEAFMKFYPLTLEDLDGEIWKWIRGYEGDYQESNFGRTKSFKNGTVKIMRPTLTKHGYLKINLHKNGKMKSYRLHKIVATTFIPNPDNKPEINHEDGCKLNNCVENLTWMTSSENKNHAHKMNLFKMPSGENHCCAKLTNSDAEFCRKVHIKGDPEFGAKALAKRFSISEGAMTQIIYGRTYKNTK